jgi:sugar phosphate isomerase/epimerase
MLALSTAYYDKNKYKKWGKILKNLRKLGLKYTELGVNIPESWIEDIKKSLQNNDIKISSIHSPCPSLGKYKYFYSLTSEDTENRLMAVKYTLKTIELAYELNAKAIVLHAGEIKTTFAGKDLYKYILNLNDFNPNQDNESLNKQKNNIWIERQQKAPKYLDLIMKSLDTIVNFAIKKNIKVGIENRLYITDVPNIEEAVSIIEKFKTPYLGYWHDVGHAEIHTRLGFVENHTKYLETLKDYLIGIHIHDIKNIRDHLPPGAGTFDFDILNPYLSDDIIKVLEVHPSSINTKQDIKKAIKKFNTYP